MGLPKGNGADNARDYLKGAIAGGGLWHALEVLDDAVLQSSVSTLNDVTLTSPNIGPSEWTDSQHTHASAATAGSTLGPGTTLSTPTLTTPSVTGVMTFTDATLQRTGAGALRLDTTLGVGVAPAAWASRVGVQIGNAGSLGGDPTGTTFTLASNSYYDGANKAIVTGAGVLASLSSGALSIFTAPSVAAGAAQAFTARAAIGTTGTLTLTPDAGTAALIANVGSGSLYITTSVKAASTPRLYSGQYITLDPAGNFVLPERAGINMGSSTDPWGTVYAATGTIQPSHIDTKEHITPLDPAAALAAVLATDAVTFTYTAPAPTAEQYELPDDPEQAEAVLHDRLVNAPLMEAARSQAGFVLQDATGTYQTDPLFETGSGQSNAANSVGVLIGAIHALESRLRALEGA